MEQFWERIVLGELSHCIHNLLNVQLLWHDDPHGVEDFIALKIDQDLWGALSADFEVVKFFICYAELGNLHAINIAYSWPISQIIK